MGDENAVERRRDPMKNRDGLLIVARVQDVDLG